jgi:NAD(P)-dependent dehydrogenase (short-subunit alcohol dehydrogenase family)
MSDANGTTADDVLDGVDLHDSVVVVTGASAGLGLESARALAARGATIVMAVRDPNRAAESTAAVGPTGHLVALDLASLDSVRRAATAILARWDRIDVLVNNAGVMATDAAVTKDGFDLQLGTNHLGHFLLTALLADGLGATSRVVNVSSQGHVIAAMNWDDPHYRQRPYSKWAAYGQSKTANVLFTRGLAAHGYTAYAVHPGMVGTDLYRHLSADELQGVRSNTLEESAKSVAEGASGIVWAATAAGIPSGSYLVDRQIAEPAAHATDPAEVERCWTWSEQEVATSFPRRPGTDIA